MAPVSKRKYESKLIKQATSTAKNRQFLIGHFKKEWEIIEKLTEKERKRRLFYTMLQEKGETLGLVVLGLTAMCGLLTIAAVAPNIFAAFGRLGSHRRYFYQRDFQRKLSYFKSRGYIKTVQDTSDAYAVRLTVRGEKQLAQYMISRFTVIPQDRWDGFWRVVVFDISEKNKWARDGLRRGLQRCGFYQLQKSVFVCPYPCREEVEFLGKLYGESHDIRFIETKVMSSDRDLREHFSLKS